MCYKTIKQIEENGHPNLARAIRSNTLPEGNSDFEKVAEQYPLPKADQPVPSAAE